MFKKPNRSNTAAQSHHRVSVIKQIFIITLLLTGVAALNLRTDASAPYAAAGIEVYAPTADQSVPSTFVVPVNVADITDASIIAFQFNIVYDPKVISPTGNNFGCSVEGTIAGASGLSAVCNVTDDNTLRVAVYGAYSITGAGTVLNVTFTTHSDASPGNYSPLHFENVYFFNAGGAVSTYPHDGQITLVDSTPTPTATPTASATATPAPALAVDVFAPTAYQVTPSIFLVPITVGDITDNGIIAFQFNILYDPMLIQPVGANFGCSTEGTLAGDAGLSAVCNVTPDGTLRVAVYGSGSIAGSGTLLNLTFTTGAAAVAGDVSSLIFENVFFFNGGGQVVSNSHNGLIILQAPAANTIRTKGRRV